MHVISYLLVIGAWLLPIVRVWASWQKPPPAGHAWLIVTLVGFALFATTLDDGSTDMLANLLGRGTVYAGCSLVIVLTLVALLRYQHLHQHTLLAASPQHIRGLPTLYRILSIVWPVAGGVVFVIEGHWMRPWVDAQRLKPFAIILHRGVLAALARGEACPAEATYLSAISYQSLDYYLLLAKMLHPQQKPIKML